MSRCILLIAALGLFLASAAFSQSATPPPTADDNDVVKITTSTRTPDGDQLKKINEVVDRLCAEQGYCPVCANDLLRYVGTLLNR